LISIELLDPNPEQEADEADNSNTPSEPETDAQIHLINDDIEQEEKEKIDKLLQDEPEEESKPRFKKKVIPPTEQPKLF
jgi:lipopolysaccharide biosynthesis glycosyltransferase